MKNFFFSSFWLKAVLAAVCMLCCYGRLKAQEHLLTVGIQFKPIIPSGLFRTDHMLSAQDNMEYMLTAAFGYSGGMMIRRGFTKRFSIESGINFTRRNYTLEITDDDSLLTTGVFHGISDFGVIDYELPLLALLYVRISDRWYMNTSLGVSLDFFPSDISTYDTYFSHLARRNHWVQAAGVINHGYEIRTEKNGILYLGGTLHWPFTIIYRSFIEYRDGLLLKDKTSMDIKGNYLTLDFRYYFQEKSGQRGK